MGVCQSSPNAQDLADAKRTKAIDQKLNNGMRKADGLIKMLFLGAGEAGKSTLFKQMRVLHGEGFDENHRRDAKEHIFSNMTEAMQTLIEQTEENYDGLTSPEAKAAAATINDLSPTSDTPPFGPEEAKLFRTLLDDPNLQKAYKNRTVFHLSQGAPYFFDNMDRLCDPDCIPTVDDLLRTRVRTTGIVEAVLQIEGQRFQIYDMGGQRTERKKWIKCFRDVTAVIFVAAASGFNEVLFEDNETNRLLESLGLFELTTNQEDFKNTAIILFLNKDDVFRAKLENGGSIKTAFPEYDGPDGYQESLDYIKDQFTERSSGDLHIHSTTATNTDNVQVVFNTVKTIIIQQSMAHLY